MTDGRNTVTAA